MEQKGAYPHPQPPPAYGFEQQQQQQQNNQYPMQPYVSPVVVEHQQQGKYDSPQLCFYLVIQIVLRVQVFYSSSIIISKKILQLSLTSTKFKCRKIGTARFFQAYTYYLGICIYTVCLSQSEFSIILMYRYFMISYCFPFVIKIIETEMIKKLENF